MRVDIGISGEQIAWIDGHQPGRGHPWPAMDVAGAMVWPCFVEAHTHLDSAHIWPRAPNPDGLFSSAAAAMIADREQNWTPHDMRRRMEFGLQTAFAHGLRAMRTHLASQNPRIRTRWEIFSELRSAWRDRIALQAVNLIAAEALCANLDAITGLVKEHDGVLGAFAPMHENLETQLADIFDAAERSDLLLDFHADETGDEASTVLLKIATEARRRGWAGRVVVGHACSLARQSAEQVERTLDAVAESGLALVALPGCNLYLQDRAPGRTPRWRGLTLVQECAARAIPICFGADNVRDPFHPYGDFDMLEVLRDGVRLGHLEHPSRDWAATITTTAATAIGVRPAALAAGAPADLVIVRARNFSELFARPQHDRILIRNGAFIEARIPDYSELDDLMQDAAP